MSGFWNRAGMIHGQVFISLYSAGLKNILGWSPVSFFDRISIVSAFEMETSENMETKKFECNICERGFSTNQYKNQHFSTVHGDMKMFTCNVCSQTFGHKHILANHLEIHEGKRKNKCNTCGKFFTTSRSLKFTSRQSMKHKEIINVILVGNLSLYLEV